MTGLLEALDALGAETGDALERFMNDEEMYLGYIRKFPGNQNIGNARAAFARGDYETVRREIHTFKGVADNLGFLTLVDAAMDVLLAIRAERQEEAEVSFAQVVGLFEMYSRVITDGE